MDGEFAEAEERNRSVLADTKRACGTEHQKITSASKHREAEQTLQPCSCHCHGPGPGAH